MPKFLTGFCSFVPTDPVNDRKKCEVRIAFEAKTNRLPLSIPEMKGILKKFRQSSDKPKLSFLPNF